jgi:hypothetical protein
VSVFAMWVLVEHAICRGCRFEASAQTRKMASPVCHSLSGAYDAGVFLDLHRHMNWHGLGKPTRMSLDRILSPRTLLA